MNIERIDDAADPRLDDFRNLMDADRRPDHPDAPKIIIAEGVNVVERLARSRYRTRAIVGVDSKISDLASRLDGVTAPVYCVDKWTLSELVGFRVSRGAVASADRPAPLAATEVLSSGARFAVLESTNDFENLGALFRNAAAFGVDGVLLDPQCADPLYRRSVRVSMGHVFAVPFAVLPAPWPESLQLFAEHRVPLYALTPRPAAAALQSIVASDRWAVMVGAEGAGLSERALAAADQWVRIPMANGVDSLNVATAAAVAFSHLARPDAG